MKSKSCLKNLGRVVGSVAKINPEKTPDPAPRYEDRAPSIQTAARSRKVHAISGAGYGVLPTHRHLFGRRIRVQDRVLPIELRLTSHFALGLLIVGLRHIGRRAAGDHRELMSARIDLGARRRTQAGTVADSSTLSAIGEDLLHGEADETEVFVFKASQLRPFNSSSASRP